MSDKFTFSDRQKNIIGAMRPGEWFAASDIAAVLSGVSAATLRRDLGELVEQGVLEKHGENKGVKYAVTDRTRLFFPYTLGAYYVQDEDERAAQEDYNFSVLPTMSEVSLFTSSQEIRMQQATETFTASAKGLSGALQQKELERFVIEFAWKSSKIEGNTYSLLDTEFLLRNGIEAPGKSKFETKMILNHKQAYLFAAESARDEVLVNVAYVEHIHRLLTDGLGVEIGLRDRRVGISGSRYVPLAVKQQLREQLQQLVDVINGKHVPYEQAMIAVLGLSYLQPFEDGNKRTARVLANSFLLRSGCAPLSYRSVDEREYKEATLIFYEQNSVVPFRELFVEQYVYAATHYNIAQPMKKEGKR